MVAPAEVTPEVAQAEGPATITVPQIRDSTVTVHVHLGAESDDSELPLLVGVTLGEADELLVERRPQTLAIHLSQHFVG